ETQIVARGLASCDTIDTDAAGVLKCGSDSTGAGGGITLIQENDSDTVTAATVIDFLGSDFTVTPTGSEGDIAIDYTNSGITRRSQNEIVTGAWQFMDVILNGSDLNIGNGITATSTFSGGYGLLGLGSTSPYGQFSIEATAIAGSNTPIFVIGDQGSSSPLLYVSGRSNDSPLIGIGTDTPSVALEIGGSVVIGTNLSIVGNLDIQGTCTGCGLGGSGTANQIAKFSNSTTLADSQLTDDGTNVGIGATSPAYKLQIQGTAFVQSSLDIGGSTNQGRINIGNGIFATSTFAGEYGKLGLGTTSPFAQFAIEATAIAGSNTPIFVIGDTGSSSSLFVVSGINGDVGIGTNSPGSKLDVGGFANIKGNLNIAATSTATSFNATGTISVGSSSPDSTLAVVGLSTFGGDVNVTGNEDVQGTLTVDTINHSGAGSTTFSGAVIVSGQLNAANLYVSNVGTTSFEGGINVKSVGGITSNSGLVVTSGSVILPTDSIQDAAIVDALTISGGTINSTTIGATASSTGNFTTLLSDTFAQTD
ncbi:MAG: hypothetical protein AAB389_04615, partial [Patescibacteria group bacterium]